MNEQVNMLIVENRANSQQKLQQTLSGWPVIRVVGAAADGEDALRIVERRQPDVVVMSTQIPVLDGIQTTQIIKALWSSVKVVLIGPQASDRRLAIEAGADAFLVDGFSDEDLLRAVIQ